jgi:hypothetical protein
VLLDLALNGAMYGIVGGALNANATVNSAIEAVPFTTDHLTPTSTPSHLSCPISPGNSMTGTTEKMFPQASQYRRSDFATSAKSALIKA